MSPFDCSVSETATLSQFGKKAKIVATVDGHPSISCSAWNNNWLQLVLPSGVGAALYALMFSKFWWEMQTNEQHHRFDALQEDLKPKRRLWALFLLIRK